MLWFLGIAPIFFQNAQPLDIWTEVEMPPPLTANHPAYEQSGFSGGPEDLTPPYTSSDIRKLQILALEYGDTASRAFPLIVSMLQPPRLPSGTVSILISYRFRRNPATTEGKRIRISAGYALDNPTDLGLVVHEMAHVVQAYRGDAPSWLAEGIADYVRYYHFEPTVLSNSGRLPATTGYMVTAQFLDWAARKYDRELVPKLNKALYEGAYTDDIWKTLTGKSLEELSQEWLKDLAPLNAP